MNNMKNKLKAGFANKCITLGGKSVNTYSTFINLYEPKISEKLIKSEKNK